MTRRTTITLRARWFGEEHLYPRAGVFMAAPRGRTVYHIVGVTRVHTAGDPDSTRFRLTCERYSRCDVPEGVPIGEWVWDKREPRRPPAKRAARSADPGPPESGKDRIARIRSKAPLLLQMAIDAIRAGRVADEVATLARVARVGQDAGVRDGRDLGHGIRLKSVVGPGRELLRSADIEIEHGADPARPNQTVRRARRVDPLRTLYCGGRITGRMMDAAEELRHHLEASASSIPSAGTSAVHVPGHQRTGFPVLQLAYCARVRSALAAVTRINHGPMLWVVVGGTIKGFERFAHQSDAVSSRCLKEGLEQLADHYYGPLNRLEERDDARAKENPDAAGRPPRRRRGYSFAGGEPAQHEESSG